MNDRLVIDDASTKNSRSRLMLSIATVAVIVAGLASRKYLAILPEILGRYPGDVLWGLMVFLGLAFLLPRAPTVRLAIAALIFSWGIEFSQLYQAPWINAIRATTIGYLVLGSGFSWPDLPAYAVGIFIGAVVDYVINRRKSGSV